MAQQSMPDSTETQMVHIQRRCLGCRNEPNVHKVEMRDNQDRWHGAQLSLIIAGHWQYYRAKVVACTS